MKRATIIQLGTPPSAYYDNVLIRANPMLHEEAFELLQSVARNGSRIIDVGSGQGAFASRLRDNGYVVTSVDKDESDFVAKEIPFIRLDFDSPEQIQSFKYTHSEKYDVAVGMEVIEHVENPWEYVRFLLSLVKPGGIVMITTPNAESVHSRIELLFTGIFLHFSKNDFESSGHINPLTFHELRLISNGIGVEVVDARSLCPLPWLIVSRRPSTLLKSIFASIVRPMMGRAAKGDIISFILRKPDLTSRNG